MIRGQAAAGEDPGLFVAVGTLVADALGGTVAVAEAAVVGLADREADALAVAVGEAPACG